MLYRPSLTTTFEINGLTHVGNVRPHNEDAVGINGSILTGSGAFSETFSVNDATQPIHCIVADGLGGHEGGEIASEYAVCALSKDGAEASGSVDFINSIHQVNKEICGKSDEVLSFRPMGTTVCGVRLSNTSGVWFWQPHNKT